MRSLLSKPEREARLARDGGWRRLIRDELGWRGRRMLGVTRMVLVARDLTQPLPVIPLPEGVVVAPYAGEEWDVFRELAGPKQRREFARRHAAGRVPLVARKADRPVGVIWITHEAIVSLEGLHLNLPEGCAYAYRLYVHPDARSGGIGSTLHNASLYHARALGFHRICAAVNVESESARKALAKAWGSSKPMGTVLFIDTLGHRWVRWTSRA